MNSYTWQMLTYSRSKMIRKMMKFAKCCFQFVKRDHGCFVSLYPQCNLAIWKHCSERSVKAKLLKSKQVNVLG